MQCGSCFEEIPDDSIFCPECGARQEMSEPVVYLALEALVWAVKMSVVAVISELYLRRGCNESEYPGNALNQGMPPG